MKYLILDSNNTILGYGDNPKGEHQASTSDPIPEYDNNIQSIYWENNQIVVKDDEQKIAENEERIATQYQRNRQMEYPSIQDQLDMQYWDSVNGTTTWKDSIAKVKSDNPKPE
jgi:hypothetical protein|tara:strand:+ start:246 stop:584 length:339 start_codon:yes stop_codon:yes gene_type:complete